MTTMSNTYRPSLTFLNDDALEELHQTSLRILSEIGMRIHSQDILNILAEQDGVSVDMDSQVATFSPEAVESAIDQTPSEFTLYGRDGGVSVTLSATGALVTQSTSGQYAWVDPVQKTRRDPTLHDLEQGIIVADALPNIDIVGALVQPTEVPVAVRDIRIFAEMLKRTRKPVRTWIHSATSAHYVLEMLQVVAGDTETLRTQPRGMFGVEPISPLVMMRESLETLKVWLKSGQPVVIAPMVQSMGTGPMTMAGTIAQQDAEILGCLVIVQTLAPGTGVVYACANLTLDPRTGNAVFACPEELLAITGGGQLSHKRGLPAGIQAGLSDAILPDAQGGMEKSTSLLMGALAGMNLSGGLGIAGCDQGACLPQLIIDNETIGFVRAVMGGFAVNEETCGFEAIQRVGIGGNFLMDSHTLAQVLRFLPRAVQPLVTIDQHIPCYLGKHMREEWHDEDLGVPVNRSPVILAGEAPCGVANVTGVERPAVHQVIDREPDPDLCVIVPFDDHISMLPQLFPSLDVPLPDSCMSLGDDLSQLSKGVLLQICVNVPVGVDGRCPHQIDGFTLLQVGSILVEDVLLILLNSLLPQVDALCDFHLVVARDSDVVLHLLRDSLEIDVLLV